MAPPIGGCLGSSQKPTTRGDAHHVEDSGPALLLSPETTAAWRTRGREVLGFVVVAERRLSVSLRLNDVTMLAAADELSAAT